MTRQSNKKRMDGIASLPGVLELAIVLRKCLPSWIRKSYADRWAALSLELKLPVLWWPLLLFLWVHFLVVVGVRSAIILNVDPAFSRQLDFNLARQSILYRAHQSFQDASQGVELGRAEARNISLEYQPPGPAMGLRTWPASIIVSPLTVRPFSAVSKAEPLVPTLPKTLLSSTAWILAILLPTRCWRRKCTHLATRNIKSTICSIVRDNIAQLDLPSAISGMVVDCVLSFWSSEPIQASGRVTRFKRGLVMQWKPGETSRPNANSADQRPAKRCWSLGHLGSADLLQNGKKKKSLQSLSSLSQHQPRASRAKLEVSQHISSPSRHFPDDNTITAN